MSTITTISTSTTQSTKSKPLIHNPIFPWSKVKLENYDKLFPRYSHSSCSNAIQDELYFFGGISNDKFNNRVFLIDNTHSVRVIETTGNIPPPRCSHTHVRTGSNLIVFGGQLENVEEKPDYNLYVFNIVTKKWTKPSIKGVTPLGRFGHTAVLMGSKMYVFGGCIDGYYLNDLVAFDTKFLDKNEACWEFIDPINEPPPGRTGHISCAYEGKIYIFGGTDGEICYNDTWYYDTITREWVELTFDTFIPVPRESHGSTLVNDVIYVFGGRTNEGRELADLAAFGINNKRWYMFQKMGPSPGPRYWLTISSSNNDVMIFGGQSAKSTQLDEGFIYVLDTSKIKYPIETYLGDSLQSNQSFPSQLQMVLSTFPQQKSLPKLRQQPTNDGNEAKEMFEELSYDNTNRLELKARNPDTSSSRPSSRPPSRPSSRPASRPTSRSFNINITTTTTTTTSTARGNLNRRSLGKDINNTRPSSITDSKKLLNTNEKIKKKKNPSQKDISPDNNNIQNNNNNHHHDDEKEISSEKQSKNSKQRNKSNLHIDTEKVYEKSESTKSSNRIYVGKSSLQRQTSVDTIRSVASVRSISSIRTLSSPSIKPKGARTLDKRNKVKLLNLENTVPSSSSSSNEVPTQEEIVPLKLEEETSTPSPTIQITPPEQEGSKPAPSRPPRRRLESLTNNTKLVERGKAIYNEEKDSITTNTPTSTSSRKISITSSDGGHHPISHLSSLERENFLERLSEADFKISEMRKREKLYQAEIDLARKAGYIPTFSFSDDSNNDDLENIIDISEFVDVGEPGSEKFKVIEAIIKLSKQLQKAKETIASQERVTSQKIADFERLYTASLEETAYFKAKFAALMNEYEAERLARTADDVEEMKQQLNEKTQKLEKTSKDVEDAKSKVEFINDQVIVSSRFKEIAARCDELEALHEMAHKELQDSLSKYKETAKNAQEALSLENKLENTTVKSQEQLVDIKNRLSQFESDYQTAIDYTTNTELILNVMKEELMQSKLEMEKLNEKIIVVENRNEILENRLKELQDPVNSHPNPTNPRNSVLQEYVDQQLEGHQTNFEKEKETLNQQIQDLQNKIDVARDEKSLMDQGYEALRRIYESMRKQNEILKKSNSTLEMQTLESGKKGEELKNELIKRVIEFKQEKEGKEEKEEKVEKEEKEEQEDKDGKEDKEEQEEQEDKDGKEDKEGQVEQEDKEDKEDKEDEEQEDKEGKEDGKDLETPLEEGKENLTTDENQEDIEQEKWEQDKKLLEQEISQYQESKRNNLELKKNVNDSENKIAILLDQMEIAVDTYRGIEDNIREGSPALVGPTLRNKISSSSLKKEVNSNSSNSDAGGS